MQKTIAVYIMTNKPHGTLYVGSTDNLHERLFQHQQRINKKSFTARYNLTKCAYIEICPDTEAALQLERRYKAYKRQWKIEMIEKLNPHWEDLILKLNEL